MYKISETLHASHWATVTGPDQGLCLPPGAFGTAHGMQDAGLGSIHGVWEWDTENHRGSLILTPQTNPTYFRPGNRGSTYNGVLTVLSLGNQLRRKLRPWRKLVPGIKYPIQIGDRVKSGKSEWEIRARASNSLVPQPETLHPDQPGSGIKNSKSALPMLTLIPIFFTLSFLMRGKWLNGYFKGIGMAAIILLGAATYWLYSNHCKRHLLDPASLLSLSAMQINNAADQKQAPIRAWLHYGWQRKRPHQADTELPHVLEAKMQDIICLAGPHAISAARWWSAQLLVRGKIAQIKDHHGSHVLNRDFPKEATPDSSPKPLVRIISHPPKAEILHPGKNEIVLICADYPCQAPLGVSQIVTVPNAIGSDSWWKQLTTKVTESLPAGTAANHAIEKYPWIIRPRAIAKQWTLQHSGLAAYLGSGTDNSNTQLDLAKWGPHALLAGTSGSGKSEALIAWLANLSVTYSPAQLAFILIDYKGGATFNRIRQLPHTMGVLTDLQPDHTARALSGLEEELKRREKLFAKHYIIDYAQWENDPLNQSNPLPRLLIAVDEFRELALTAPTQMNTLIRLAGQGRSLGMHLILATQRPAGIVDSTIRANCPVRIALRTADATDSYDILGDARAAKLAHIPGMAIIEGAVSDTIRFDYLRPEDLNQLVKGCQIAALTQDRSKLPERFWSDPLPERLSPQNSLLMAAEGAPQQPYNAEQKTGRQKLNIGLIDSSPTQPAQIFQLTTGALTLAYSETPGWLMDLKSSITWSAKRQGWSIQNLIGPYLKISEELTRLPSSPGIVIIENAYLGEQNLAYPPANLLTEALQIAQNKNLSILLIENRASHIMPVRASAHQLLIPHDISSIDTARLGMKIPQNLITNPAPQHGLVLRDAQLHAFVVTQNE